MSKGRTANLTLAANATTSNGAAVAWPGGKGVSTAEATWGGGTAKLQFKTLNGTWVDVPNCSHSANGTLPFELPAGEIRTVIATATACYHYAQPLPY